MLNKVLRYGALCLGACTLSVGAWAQTFPSKTIRISVGFLPGGSADVVARIYAQKLSESLGQSVVVENRAGAAGAMAADLVAKSDPDGYRLLMLPSSTFVYSVLSKSVTYQIERDFTPVSYLGYTPLVLAVNPALPARTVDELVALARSKPMSYGSDGVGGFSQLSAELFSQKTGIKLLHIPFKSAVESTVATAGGQVDMNFPALTSALPLLRSEKQRAIAVTSLQRSSLLPAVPTLDELGVRGYNQVAWFGFVGPANLPAPVVARLRTAIAQASTLPEVKEALAKQGVEPETKTPEQFASFIRESAAQISLLAKDIDIRLD